MTNPPKSSRPLITQVAARIVGRIEEDGVTYKHLSRKTGIPHSTLRDHLLYNPGRLNIDQAFHIANALRLDMSELVR